MYFLHLRSNVFVKKKHPQIQKKSLHVLHQEVLHCSSNSLKIVYQTLGTSIITSSHWIFLWLCQELNDNVGHTITIYCNLPREVQYNLKLPKHPSSAECSNLLKVASLCIFLLIKLLTNYKNIFLNKFVHLSKFFSISPVQFIMKSRATLI